MGCAESSELVPEDVAAELYRLQVARKKGEFESLLHSVLWHQGRQPDWAFIKKVLSEPIATTSRDWKETLVHYAVRFNDTLFLEEMVHYDPPLNAKNSHGNNIVHTCCISGASADTFALLTKEIPMVSSSSGQDGAPASPPGSPLSDGTGVLDVPNEDGDCPLHLAARNHFGWLVEMLIQRGARRTCINREGDTPLQLLKNAHNRNPLSRGNVAVGRKKAMKVWWEKPKMHLPYILALLDDAQGPAVAADILQQHTAHLNSLLDAGGSLVENRSSGSFENSSTGTVATAAGGGAAGGDNNTAQGGVVVGNPLFSNGMMPRTVSNSSTTQQNGGAADGKPSSLAPPVNPMQVRRGSGGSTGGGAAAGVKSVGMKRLIDVKATGTVEV